MKERSYKRIHEVSPRRGKLLSEVSTIRFGSGIRYKDWEDRNFSPNFKSDAMKGGEGVKNKTLISDRPRFYQWVNGKRIRRRELEQKF
jgi:hypothetical protein